MKLSKFNMFFNISPNFTVIYNALHDSLVLVDKETERSLREGNLANIPSDSKEFKNLLRTGVLVEDNVDEDSLLQKKRLELSLSHKYMGLWLSLTNKCNLACKYCYQSTRALMEGEDLSPERWHKVYSYIIRKVKEGLKVITMTLYGGEPLLNPSMALRIIKDLDLLAQEFDVVSGVGLITNGTVYNDDVGEIFERVFQVQITIDGPREVHNERRPFKSGEGSFDVIFNNLVKIIDRHKTRVSLRVNVDEHNVDYVEDFINMLAELRLRDRIAGIDLSPVQPDQAVRYVPFKTSKNYYEYYINISRKIVDLLEYAVEKGFKIGRVITWWPCMCKLKQSYAVDEKLNLYYCPGFMYSPVGYIGYISQDDVVLVSAAKERIVTNIPSCAYNCKLGPVCYGGCVYLESLGIPVCPYILYGEEYLERLVRAYVLSRYREVIARAGDSGGRQGY